MTATYTAPEPEVAPEPEPEPEPAEPARNGLSGGALAGIIGGAAALIIGGFLIIPPILGRRLKFRLTETVAGRERKVSDIPCSAKDGLIDVELPAGLDFANHDYHGTFLPGSTAKKDVMVSFYTVTNGERQELRPAAKIAPEYTFSNLTH